MANLEWNISGRKLILPNVAFGKQHAYLYNRDGKSEINFAFPMQDKSVLTKSMKKQKNLTSNFSEI